MYSSVSEQLKSNCKVAQMLNCLLICKHSKSGHEQNRKKTGQRHHSSPGSTVAKVCVAIASSVVSVGHLVFIAPVDVRHSPALGTGARYD